MNFFATAAKGTEPALRDELRELRFSGVRCDRGGVHFAGAWEEGWRACLHSRIAMDVVVTLAEFDAPDGQTLLEGVRAIDFSPYLTPRHTLAVHAVCRSSALTHNGFIALKVKDGIVDRLRDRVGSRPSVDRKDPDVSVFARVIQNRASIGVDLSGAPLNQRGYRRKVGDAPLKETLAAAMLRLCGWDRTSPLMDPMCGSGTLPVEAALWASGVAPGLGRKAFGFERWAGHDDAAARRMAGLREAARAGADASRMPELFAGDVDPRMVEMAQSTAREAGARIRFHCGSMETAPRFDRPGFVVVNPPYGERIGIADDLYRKMGRAFRERRGDTVAVLAGHPDIRRALGGRPVLTRSLFNGPLECELLVYRF
jgi:putative N6-adenine-specific DNA methylase